MCPAAAFINLADYKTPGLASKSDKEFHAWAGKAVRDKLIVEDAYKNLYDCWKVYHTVK